MNIKDIRTAVIAHSLSPIGDAGELKKRLTDYYRENGGIGGSSSAAKEESNVPANDEASAKMRALLEAIVGNEGDNAFVLSLSGKEVTKLSGKPDLRKAYLLLSTKVHPDKNNNSKESVQAFQIVLSAYEGLCNPQEEGDDEKPAAKRQKTERFTRSNSGCHKTKVACPQCKQTWGTGDLGLEDAAYNFLMMGIKKYICGRCFCKFGCMTAIHYCPHCKKTFEYDSDDYHRQIVCGSEKCKKQFGFWMFKVAEKREKEVRQDVKKEFEEERKQLAQKKRRAARADRRVDKGDSTTEERLQEQLFLIGSRDVCPRCGWSVERGDGLEEIKQHLEGCNDKKAIAEYKKRVAKEKAEAEKKKMANENQYEVMALKRWQLNGRQVGQLWMLSEHNIRKQCEDFGISTEGAKHECIARLRAHIKKKQTLLLTDGKTTLQNPASQYDVAGIEHVDDEDLPQNIHELDREELQDLCASYQVQFDPKKDVKANLLKKFQTARSQGREQLLICGKKTDSSDEEGANDGSDEEYKIEMDA